jgi:hypothetical protein
MPALYLQHIHQPDSDLIELDTPENRNGEQERSRQFRLGLDEFSCTLHCCTYSMYLRVYLLYLTGRI